MKTYTFNYRIGPDSSDISYTCCAERLSSALRLFGRWQETFKSGPIMTLLPHYTVVNEDGKLSSRVLPSKYMN